MEGYKAISIIVKMNGWEEYDVSNFITINLDHNMYNSFIGTKEEVIMWCKKHNVDINAIF